MHEKETDVSLTRDQRRLLGVAIAMAQADGVLERRERELIDVLTGELGLVGDARAEVERMIEEPPTAKDIAGWCVTPRDRLDIYAAAVQMAEADDRIDKSEAELLHELAHLLELSASDLEHATALGRGTGP